MYRARVHFFPKTMEAFAEAVAAGEEFKKICAAKGWVEPTFWGPTVGEVQELIVEYDYPDLVSFQRQNEEGWKVPEAMAVWQKLMSMEATRTPYSELQETVPSFG